MDNANPTIAYLGPAGTYSDEAARTFAKRLGSDEPRLLECTSFDEVFDCVDRGRCAYGVVPTENSLEGPVTATLDNFALQQLRHHPGRRGARHPPLAWCCIPKPTSNDVDRGRVARPGPRAVPPIPERADGRTGDHHHLVHRRKRAPGRRKTRMSPASPTPSPPNCTARACAEADIEDHFGNQTSFVLIARPGHPPVLRRHAPQDLARAVLAGGQGRRAADDPLGIRLCRHQPDRRSSRAPRSRPWESTCSSSTWKAPRTTSQVQTALNCLRLKLREVKVLGSYPVA